MSSPCPQTLPGTIKCDSVDPVVCLLTVANLMSQHIGLIRNKSKVKATGFLINGIFSIYSNKATQTKNEFTRQHKLCDVWCLVC